jgi:hypothetical protein
MQQHPGAILAPVAQACRMNTIAHHGTLGRRRAHPQALTRTIPRLSRGAGFWASRRVARPHGLLHRSERPLWAVRAGAAFVLANDHDRLRGYSAGVVASLLFAGHVSDWYGRRAVLIPALVIKGVAALVFVAWQSLASVLVARVLTSVALGAAVATATAYIADLDAGPDGSVSRHSGIVATVANIGGLALGPLIAGVLAQYARRFSRSPSWCCWLR